MPRLFIALQMDPEVRRYLQPVNTFISNYKSDLKSVESGNYHITLKFFGECGDDKVEEIFRIFREIPVPSAEIAFKIIGIGAFPSPDRASVIWAGLETNDMTINKLQENVEKYTMKAGFKPEDRKFVPHLTIARVRKEKKINSELIKYIRENKNTLYGESTFSKLTLYTSKLTPNGPIYTDLRSAVFGSRK